MVIATLRVFPAHDQRRHLLGVLRSVQGPIQAQPHCQSCRIYEEDGYDEAICYMERWDSEPEFERHIRSELYRRILAAAELSRLAPEITFDFVTNTRGLDLVKALRGAQDQSPHPT